MPRRHANDDGRGRHVARHDRARADDRIGSDADALSLTSDSVWAVALYGRISRGAAVELRVGCRHAGSSETIAEGSDGTRTIAGTKRVKVETLEVVE